jgi:hypothetical protein
VGYSSGKCINYQNLTDRVGAVPATPIIDLDTLFTPPFKLQAGPIDNGHGKDKGKGK